MLLVRQKTLLISLFSLVGILSLVMLLNLSSGQILAYDDPTPTSTAVLETDIPHEDDHNHTHGEWEEVSSMPTARSEMRAVVIDGLIYVPGGIGNLQRHGTLLEIFDPATNEWTVGAELPVGRHHIMTVSFGTQLYIFGGYPSGSFDLTNTVYMYDSLADIWTELANLPHPRAAGEAIVLGDHIYLIGGEAPLANPPLLRYNPADDTWEILAEMSTKRDHVAAVALGGEIYALGGRVRGEDFATVEIFNLTTGEWHTGTPMNAKRSGFGAVVLDGQIVVVGGETFAGGVETLDSVEIYDPATDAWTYVMPMPYVLHGTQIVNVDGVLYVIGGSDVGARAINSGRVIVYRP